MLLIDAVFAYHFAAPAAPRLLGMRPAATSTRIVQLFHLSTHPTDRPFSVVPVEDKERNAANLAIVGLYRMSRLAHVAIVIYSSSK